jgi:hypothetical protein
MENVLKKKTVSFYHFRSIVANYPIAAILRDILSSHDLTTIDKK